MSKYLTNEHTCNRQSFYKILCVGRTLCKFHIGWNSLLQQNILQANIGESDQTLRSAASDLGLRCLHMSHKRALGLYGLVIVSMVTLNPF